MFQSVTVFNVIKLKRKGGERQTEIITAPRDKADKISTPALDWTTGDDDRPAQRDPESEQTLSEWE